LGPCKQETLAASGGPTPGPVLRAGPRGPLTEAITAHDQHLIDHVDAYAAKDYSRAQQMLDVANTLVV
jgi:hypothetical protein